jgi:quercetin dioxygenase-like cupin family protein
MSKVRIHRGENIDWQPLRTIYPPEMALQATDKELDSSFSDTEPGLDGSLHMSEFDFQPGASFDLHAHDLDEIIYVVDGSLHPGSRSLGAGSSVYIAGDTLYGFAAGEEGARVLVFRADGRVKNWDKDEYLRTREERHEHPAEA